jgi:hypothetical protein
VAWAEEGLEVRGEVSTLVVDLLLAEVVILTLDRMDSAEQEAVRLVEVNLAVEVIRLVVLLEATHSVEVITHLAMQVTQEGTVKPFPL